jgi:hypothetical protein
VTDAIARTTPPRTSGEKDVATNLVLAFSPIHKRALGTAVGTICGLVVFAMTALHVAFEPNVNLELLGQYFYGYTVTWRGAFIGLLWGFFVGFVAGWFLAFTRNLVVATSLWVTRTRAELDATRDFLDHI